MLLLSDLATKYDRIVALLKGGAAWLNVPSAGFCH